MTGGGRGRRGVRPASTVQAVEAALVVLSLAVFGARGADWPLPEWALVLAPTLLASTVLVHRLPSLWRTLRGITGVASTAGVVWIGLEVVLAAGFLVVLAVVVVTVLGSLGAAASGAFEVAGSGIRLVVVSAVAAGALALLLLLAVGVRLVATAVRSVGA